MEERNVSSRVAVVSSSVGRSAPRLRAMRAALRHALMLVTILSIKWLAGAGLTDPVVVVAALAPASPLQQIKQARSPSCTRLIPADEQSSRAIHPQQDGARADVPPSRKFSFAARPALLEWDATRRHADRTPRTRASPTRARVSAARHTEPCHVRESSPLASRPRTPDSRAASEPPHTNRAEGGPVAPHEPRISCL